MAATRRWTLSLEERFWSKVDREPADPDGCWLWLAYQHKGYGLFHYQGMAVKAPRIAWLLTHGRLPIAALHKCDNPPCVRPDHLFEGDQIDNVNDMWNKDRGQRGATHYRAKLTEESVHAIRAASAAGVRPFQLAAQYGVHRMTIKAILTNRTWKRT